MPDGYFAHPLAYAIKMFNLGSKGQMLASTVKTDTADMNFVAYAVLGADKNLYVTLLNKEHNATGRDADVTIQTGGNYTKAESIALTAPNGDVSAKDGITLGGAGIAHDGTLKESWSNAPAPSGGTLHITVPACSVLLVRLH